MDDELKRDFYAEMCRIEKWSTRTLDKKIAGMLFERTALSKKPDKLIRQELAALREEDKLTPDLVFRDPYVLDFLGLKDTYAEKDVEAAILREIESFILDSASASPFSNGRSGCGSMRGITISTCCSITLYGLAGVTYQVQSSINPVASASWLPLRSVQLTNSFQTIRDTKVPGPIRVFRVLKQ